MDSLIHQRPFGRASVPGMLHLARGALAVGSSRKAEQGQAGRSAAASGAQQGRSAGSPKRRPVQRWGWRLAAGVALAAFGAVLFFLFQRNQHTVTVTAEGDAPRIVSLAGGSTVRLMPGATLAYIDPAAEVVFDRQATLEAGRAFFDVASTPEGFLVETPTARIRVLGTRFAVTTEGRLTHVVLATGQLALASKAAARQPVALRPGQSSRVARGALPSTPVAVDSLAEALAWTGLFVFQGEPAAAVAARLAAHYDVAVTVAPPLRSEAVTGTFERARPLRETLDALAATVNATAEPRHGDGYRLVPRE